MFSDFHVSSASPWVSCVNLYCKFFFHFILFPVFQLSELEREKRLILEGKMGVEDAPYIANHPVFKVSKMANSIFEDRRKKVNLVLANVLYNLIYRELKDQ